MLLSSTNFLFWKARRELWGGLTTRCFPSKEDKDMFIFEFCSPFNLGMYIVSSLVRFLFTRCVNIIALTNREIIYKYIIFKDKPPFKPYEVRMVRLKK